MARRLHPAEMMRIDVEKKNLAGCSCLEVTLE
jgi:hypothetical protein